VVQVEEFEQLAERVSNWGRWGADDQRGTLNFITPAVVARSAAAVVTGEAFSLGMDLSPAGPQTGIVAGRINPLRTMLAINKPIRPAGDSPAYSDDIVTVPLQGATHWDALSHMSRGGLLYNGIPAEVIGTEGATKLGIDAAGVIFSRGVLLDVARHEQVDKLPDRYEITNQVLRDVEKAQGTPVADGDIVLIRTGACGAFLRGDRAGYRAEPSGLVYDAPLFFSDRNVAAVAIDNMPAELRSPDPADVDLPVHVLCLIMMGLPLGENWVLEDLAAACGQDRRYSFLLSATPERFVYSTGGMVNPVAVR
jgi:kynurenine formamidase